MLDATIVYGEEKFSLWDFPESFSYRSGATRLCFEDSPSLTKAKKILEQCEQIASILESAANPRNIFVQAHHYFFEQTLGHADYVSQYYNALDAS